MTTDPVSDMLSRIRNAILARHPRVEMPLSKLKVRIAQILKDEGFVDSFTVQTEGHGTLTILLKYGRDRTSAIVGLRRCSRPGRRHYVKHTEMPKVLSGMGISIVSTSRGLLTSRQAANDHVGGELLCEVW